MFDDFILVIVIHTWFLLIQQVKSVQQVPVSTRQPKQTFSVPSGPCCGSTGSFLDTVRTTTAPTPPGTAPTRSTRTTPAWVRSAAASTFRAADSAARFRPVSRRATTSRWTTSVFQVRLKHAIYRKNLTYICNQNSQTAKTLCTLYRYFLNN